MDGGKLTKLSQFIYSSKNAVLFQSDSAILDFHDGGYDNFVKDVTIGSTFESSAYVVKSVLSLGIMALVH